MILRDPVHGLVAFEADEEQIVERLMDTPEVQRLRRVRQLGVTSLAFPGAEHTRFAHAVGAAFVMKLLLTRLRATPHHEAWTERIVLDPSTGVHRVLAELDPQMPSRVAALVRGEHELPYLAKAVS